MALIKCEECGKEISDKAFKCEYCGIPRNEDELVRFLVTMGNKIFRAIISDVFWFCVFFGIVGFILVSVFGAFL
tara:strand:+ start:599 stop:820 length:222 start_codon:yes stop_codon:yes gene_type:complete